MRGHIRGSLPFFSPDDINMTAMSKRPALARLRSTSSVTAGPSLLHSIGVFKCAAFIRWLLNQHIRLKLTSDRNHAESSGSYEARLVPAMCGEWFHSLQAWFAAGHKDQKSKVFRNSAIFHLKCGNPTHITACLAHPQISVNRFRLVSNVV